MRDAQGRQRDDFAARLRGAEGEIGVFAGGEGFIESRHDAEQRAVEEHVARGDEAEGLGHDGGGVALARGGILVVPVGMPRALDPVAAFRRRDGIAEQDGDRLEQPRGGVFQPVAVGHAVAVEERERRAAGGAEGVVAADGNRSAGMHEAFVEARLAGGLDGAVAAAAVDENGFKAPAFGQAQVVERVLEAGQVLGLVEGDDHDGQDVLRVHGFFGNWLAAHWVCEAMPSRIWTSFSVSVPRDRMRRMPSIM